MRGVRVVVCIVGVFLLCQVSAFAYEYSKQDIKNLVEYFKENDTRSEALYAILEGKFEQLINESYRDLKEYYSKDKLKQRIKDLYGQLLSYCGVLEKQPSVAQVKAGYYDIKAVSPDFNKMNLEAAYILLKIKVLGYVYQYTYREQVLTKEAYCSVFYFFDPEKSGVTCKK